MKILFVTPQLPYPPDKGTTIRNYALLKGMAQRGHDVHLLSFIRSEEDLAWARNLQPCCHKITTVIAPQRSTVTRLRTFILSSLPDMAWRLPSPEFQEKLSDLLEREFFDIVQVEGIEVAQYALGVLQEKARRPDQPGPVVIFDDHNAEYVLQKRAWEIDRRYVLRWPKAFYSWVQWRRLRRYEAHVCRGVDKVLAVSDADAEAIAALGDGLQATVIPNGVDCAFFSQNLPPPDHPVPSPIRHIASLVFTGTMDFRPNIDAALWFCQEILPRIKKDVFHVHFYIVGKSPVKEVRMLAGPAVTVTGYVSDIRPYIAHSSVYVVPIRMGSGTKLKVLQAMAMNIPVVSTTTGAEGIDAVPDRDILIADAPDEFARRVVTLLDNAEQRRQLAANARKLVEEKYDWSTILPALEDVYTQSLADRR